MWELGVQGHVWRLGLVLNGEMNGGESGETCITGLISCETKNAKRHCSTSWQHKYCRGYNFPWIALPPPALHVIIFWTCLCLRSSLTKSVFSFQEEEMPEVEIDIDDLLEVNSDDERASKLQVPL